MPPQNIFDKDHKHRPNQHENNRLCNEIKGPPLHSHSHSHSSFLDLKLKLTETEITWSEVPNLVKATAMLM